MIIDVKEYTYKGFVLRYVEDKGWKFSLCETEYLFPYSTAAEKAIDTFINDVIPANKGKKLPRKI